MKCPSCGYQRKKSDKVPDWQCPACKVAYIKCETQRSSKKYELQVSYELKPGDSEILPDVIYLYLVGKEYVEYALLDQDNEVKRFRLFDNELGSEAKQIKKILSNTNERIDKDQEKLLFKVFSQKDYLQGVYIHRDNTLYYKKSIKNKLKKRRKILFIIFIFISVAALFYFRPQKPVSLIKNIKNPARVYNGQNQSENFSRDVKSNKIVNLKKRGIDLAFISSKLYVVDALVKECRNICQLHREVDDSCNKANEIMKDIHSQIYSYKEFFRKHNLKDLQRSEQQLVLSINNYIENIGKEMETAKNFCNRNSIVNKVSDHEKIDFMDDGINLHVLYSKLFTANNELRNCRLYCEAGSNVLTNCSIFANLQSEYTTEVNRTIKFINSHSITINSTNVSVDDKRYLRQIFDLLDEIERERKKVIKCINNRQI